MFPAPHRARQARRAAGPRRRPPAKSGGNMPDTAGMYTAKMIRPGIVRREMSCPARQCLFGRNSFNAWRSAFGTPPVIELGDLNQRCDLLAHVVEQIGGSAPN
jgi:hypothetical protein